MAFQYNSKAFQGSWEKVKKTIQAPHLYPKINKSTIRQADAWASGKWGCAFDYINILRYLGVEIIDD